MSLWDLIKPEVNEETGRLYYTNEYLGITIDFWPFVFAGFAILLVFFLIVNGFLTIPPSPGIGYNDGWNRLSALGQLGQLGHGLHSHGVEVVALGAPSTSCTRGCMPCKPERRSCKRSLTATAPGRSPV